MLVAGSFALVGCTVGEGDNGHENGGAPPDVTGANAGERGFTSIVERVGPSVVTVQTGRSVGSGVVYQPDVVVTNAHVVGETAEVTISYADATTSPGEVLATDPVTDLAVIRTSRDGLPVPTFREDLPAPGEAAVAIGSPLGFENSVTAGIISGLHRKIPGSAGRTQSLVDLIQTDAPISPGNSGGALLDAQGRVVGINEAYIPPSAGAVSLGFAVPTATVLDIAAQLLDDGTATHSYLGLSLGQLTPAIREQLNLEAEQGALVVAVDQDGPASSAGVRAGDVVTRFADHDIAAVEDLLAALRDVDPGERTAMTVLRDGKQEQLTITVGQRTK